jgi:hypothetical protein
MQAIERVIASGASSLPKPPAGRTTFDVAHLKDMQHQRHARCTAEWFGRGALYGNHGM